jgi:cell division protein ZapE
MNLERRYQQKVMELGLKHDAVQLDIVRKMQGMQERLVARESPLRRALRRIRAVEPDEPSGLYLWGDVGRGKTFLMDLLFETLEIDRKRRVHFHRLMADVHARLRELADEADPLQRVAADIADEAHVLCFDEFFVSDIGDAMILGRLLEGLFSRGVVLVATSNTPPAGLYRAGLQRERFLPAIALLEEHTHVLHMNGDVDYRLQFLQAAGTFLCPADAAAESRLIRSFHEIASGYVEQNAVIDLCGRKVRTIKRAKDVAWFDFAELCEGPRSQQDYIEIARRYQTVIVSGVPVMTADHENPARRFVALVDEFYDRRVKLILSAVAEIESLYRGSKLAFEFQRTVSRLVEMQSANYLHSAHLS